MSRPVGGFLVLGISYYTRRQVSLSPGKEGDGINGKTGDRGQWTYQPAFFDKMADSMSGVSIHGFWGLYTVFIFVLDGDRGWEVRSVIVMILDQRLIID